MNSEELKHTCETLSFAQTCQHSQCNIFPVIVLIYDKFSDYFLLHILYVVNDLSPSTLKADCFHMGNYTATPNDVCLHGNKA